MDQIFITLTFEKFKLIVRKLVKSALTNKIFIIKYIFLNK